MSNVFPLPYRLFFLYVEPISALAGAYYAAAHQDDYLCDLVTPTERQFTRVAVDTPTSMSLFQLANLYLLFALNEHLVLSSTSSLKLEDLEAPFGLSTRCRFGPPRHDVSGGA
jgi:hypothetical protein